MNTSRDVVIVGAGPAGLAAAQAASGYGLDVLVLDEQPFPGGQIYRNIENASGAILAILGKDYSRGRCLVDGFRASNVEYLDCAVVWRIDAGGKLCFSRRGKAIEIRGKHVLLATGAMERPFPFRGWTLPGVMGVGAVDANFKSSGTIPLGPVVLAGSGPLLLATAGHLSSLGVTIAAILDTTPVANVLSCLPLIPKALRRPDYLLKGIGMIVKGQLAGIRYIRGVTEYSAHGKECLDYVSYKTSRGLGRLEAAALLVHEGIVPRCDLTRQVGLTHLWNPVQRYWYPKTTAFGATDIKTIHVAGDGAFVYGGIPAQLKGTLAAVNIATNLKALPNHKKFAITKRIKQHLYRELAPRPFVDALFKPRPNLYKTEPDTLVCRCENITAGGIRQAVAEGCREPDEIKAMTRCGMGPCQARMCGMALAEIAAEALGLESFELRTLNIRPPVRNLSLEELAGLQLLEGEPH